MASLALRQGIGKHAELPPHVIAPSIFHRSLPPVMEGSDRFVTVTVVLQTLFSLAEFGMCCVANVWDMSCLQTFGMCCVADGQGVCIERYS